MLSSIGVYITPSYAPLNNTFSDCIRVDFEIYCNFSGVVIKTGKFTDTIENSYSCFGLFSNYNRIAT